MSDFDSSYPFPVGGGLNLADAPEFIEDDEALELVNMRFEGLGRWGPRYAAAAVEAGLSNVCGIFGMPHGTDAGGAATGVVYLDAGAGGVQLYAADGSGRNATLVGTLAGWETVIGRPKVLAAVAGERLWIVDEEKLYGLTVYDPNDRSLTGTKLFQPQFRFDLGFEEAPSPIFARCVAAFSNHLFVAGYGSEHDPDRPELVRFSYLGQEADSEGAGDAGLVDAPVFGSAEWDSGVEHAPGSKNLFDLEDVFYIGVRGQPVMAMVPAAERLLILTRFTAHMLFGYDRFSFEADLLDNQRGCTASRAAGQANGSAWWWSPLGPTVWSGGVPRGLERKLLPRLRQVHYDSMIFAHQPSEYEVRWYWSDDAGDAYRGECYHYLFDRWREDKLGLRVFCAGVALPGTILRPGPGGDPIPDPDPGEDPTLPAPTNLQFSEITANTGKATWVPGIVAPQITTRVWRKVPGGEYVLSFIPFPSGISALTLLGLPPATLITVKVEHLDTTTGRVSAPLEGTFTTAAAGTLNPPTGFAVTVGTFLDPDTGRPSVYVTIRWTLGQNGVYTQVQFKPAGVTSWDSAASNRAPLNGTSFIISGPPSGGSFDPLSGLWTFRARHTSTATYDEVLNPNGTASVWTNEVTVDMGAAS